MWTLGCKRTIILLRHRHDLGVSGETVVLITYRCSYYYYYYYLLLLLFIIIIIIVVVVVVIIVSQPEQCYEQAFALYPWPSCGMGR